MLKSLKKYVLGMLSAVGLMAVSVSAHAVLPTEASAAFTTLSGNVTDIVAAIWPILATVVGAFALMKLFRKGASKAI